MPAQSVRTWFDPIIPLKLEKSVLTVQVPSQFFYEQLEQNYVDVLRKAICCVIGKAAKLEYSILIDKSNKAHANLQVSQSSKSTLRGHHTEAQQKELVAPDFVTTSLQSMMGRLHTQYIFDNFICGPGNLMLKQAGMSIADQPGQTVFSPMVVYGEVGFGKTHFIQAVAHRMMAGHPNLRVVYLSGEQFVNQFVLSLRRKQMQAFCDFYLQADALLIDDIQFLKEKERTQEFFFHIFNHLHQGGKQLVFTCDTPPAELKGMHERLISRFKWGLTLQLQLPDQATRHAILKKRAAQEGISLPDEVLEYVAEHANTNVRELEGALISLIAHAVLSKKEIDLQLAQDVTEGIFHKKPIKMSIGYIQETVSQYFNVSTPSLSDKTQRREVVIARQVAMYFVKQHTNHSLNSIGQYFGKRDPRTVTHSLQSVNNLQQTDKKMQKALKILAQRLQLTT